MGSAKRGQTSACEHVVNCEIINVIVWTAERTETRDQMGMDGDLVWQDVYQKSKLEFLIIFSLFLDKFSNISCAIF